MEGREKNIQKKIKNDRSNSDDSANSTEYNNSGSLNLTNDHDDCNQIEIKTYDLGNMNMNSNTKLNLNNSSEVKIDLESNNYDLNNYYGNTFQIWFDGNCPKIVIGPHCKLIYQYFLLNTISRVSIFSYIFGFFSGIIFLFLLFLVLNNY
jgi:hypothetical protein